MTIRTRRIEIRIETHEIKVTRFSGGRFPVHCDECDAIVRFDRNTISGGAGQGEETRGPSKGGIQNTRRKK